ncbi:hypothetical protein [Sphingobium sp. KCTC 72723]|uniref:hypothetical protein n=1 Tax=Sphingobium sp. KCTC 72723 TaxID=2733867 RepID=UPI003977C42C
MPAQRVGLVIAPEEIAILKDRHDFAHETVKLAGVTQMNIHTIKRPSFEPTLYFIGDRLCRPDKRTAAPGAQTLDRLAKRQPFADGQISDLLGLRIEAALGIFERLDREGGVGIVAAEVMPAERATEFGQRLIETLVERLIVTFNVPRLIVSVANDDRKAGQDDDLVGITVPARSPAFEIRVEGLPLFDRRCVGEDRISDGGTEMASLVAVACLEDDRFALG